MHPLRRTPERARCAGDASKRRGRCTSFVAARAGAALDSARVAHPHRPLPRCHPCARVAPARGVLGR
jgi:hypothetical protein